MTAEVRLVAPRTAEGVMYLDWMREKRAEVFRSAAPGWLDPRQLPEGFSRATPIVRPRNNRWPWKRPCKSSGHADALVGPCPLGDVPVAAWFWFASMGYLSVPLDSWPVVWVRTLAVAAASGVLAVGMAAVQARSAALSVLLAALPPWLLTWSLHLLMDRQVFWKVFFRTVFRCCLPTPSREWRCVRSSSAVREVTPARF